MSLTKAQLAQRAEVDAAWVGKRVEISPSHDLWMRGARFGTVHSVKRGTLESGQTVLRIRMDHPQVRRLVRTYAANVTLR